MPLGEFISCGNCFNGIVIARAPKGGEQIAKECDCLLAYQHLAYLENSFLTAGIEDTGYEICDFTGLNTTRELLGKIPLRWHKMRGKALFFRGLHQTQKTTQAKAVLRECIRSHRARGLFIDYGELCDKLISYKSIEKGDAEEAEQMRDFYRIVKQSSIIVIDRFLEKRGLVKYRFPYVYNHLEEFLRLRCQDKLLILTQVSKDSELDTPPEGSLAQIMYQQAVAGAGVLSFTESLSPKTFNIWED